jgi:bacteriorhodopsin
MMYNMTYGQHQLVYNFTSFTLASMMACTVFFWLRLPSIAEKYKTALVITGLVTFIAFYHYVRIFNSWNESYAFPAATGHDEAPQLTGKPFNDAYRYMDWLLTVPLLLMELIMVMKFDSEAEAKQKSAILGSAAGLMILLGYPGELITEGPQLGTRWMWWAASMCPFVYIVYTLLVGLQAATEKETKQEVKDLIRLAQRMTVVSWCTYPVVYIFPMLGFSGAGSVVGIQIGYCVSDIISKCGVGLLTYNIAKTKSSLGLLGDEE